jgi:hypothetical protein
MGTSTWSPQSATERTDATPIVLSMQADSTHVRLTTAKGPEVPRAKRGSKEDEAGGDAGVPRNESEGNSRYGRRSRQRLMEGLRVIHGHRNPAGSLLDPIRPLCRHRLGQLDPRGLHHGQRGPQEGLGFWRLRMDRDDVGAGDADRPARPVRMQRVSSSRRMDLRRVAR